MSLLQLGFLALVFIGTVALTVWLTQWVGSSAVTARVKRLAGHAQGAEGTMDAWIQRVARATAPLGKLSAPEEGFEASALRRRFVNAGIRHPAAPATFFGVKTALAVGLPLLAFTVLTLAHSPAKGNNLLFVLL